MMAKGRSAGGNQMRRDKIGFDDDTRAEIRSTASAAGVSIAERVRQLVELGLETEKQEKAYACGSTHRVGKKTTSSPMSRS